MDNPDNLDLEFIINAYKVFMYDFFDEKDQRRYIVYEIVNNEEELQKFIQRAEKQDNNYAILEWDNPIFWNDRDVIKSWKIPGKNTNRVEFDLDLLKDQVTKEVESKDSALRKKKIEEFTLAQINNDTVKENKLKTEIRNIGSDLDRIKNSSDKEEILNTYRNYKRNK